MTIIAEIVHFLLLFLLFIVPLSDMFHVTTTCWIDDNVQMPNWDVQMNEGFFHSQFICNDNITLDFSLVQCLFSIEFVLVSLPFVLVYFLSYHIRRPFFFFRTNVRQQKPKTRNLKWMKERDGRNDEKRERKEGRIGLRSMIMVELDCDLQCLFETYSATIVYIYTTNLMQMWHWHDPRWMGDNNYSANGIFHLVIWHHSMNQTIIVMTYFFFSLNFHSFKYSFLKYKSCSAAYTSIFNQWNYSKLKYRSGSVPRLLLLLWYIFHNSWIPLTKIPL